MNYLLKRFFMAAFFLSSSWATSAAMAQSSPVGVWRTIDDATGKPAALIRITDNHGELQGKIEKLFVLAVDDDNPLCTQCTDERKNQPIIGMTILNGMRADGEIYRGGRILDPDTGNVYTSRMTLTDGGRKLEVRGYIGVPLLGRSQIWLREP